MKIGGFKDANARARFDAAYALAMERVWPESSVAVDVPTPFGTTRAYRLGPPGGKPIVLLPGAGGNALMWHRQIGALSERHEVVAVDTVGEPGASMQTAPITGGGDAAAWLDALLDGLGVDEAHLVGCSYGGWLALHAHLHRPDRSATLTLVDPAGLADPGWRFYAWIIAGGLAGAAPRRLRPPLARMVGNGTILDADLMALVRASTGFRRRLPAATAFTDAQLRRVAAPSLFLLGGRSALHRSDAAAERLAALVPDARIEVVPGAGHALPTDRPELVAERVIATTDR